MSHVRRRPQPPSSTPALGHARVGGDLRRVLPVADVVGARDARRGAGRLGYRARSSVPARQGLGWLAVAAAAHVAVHARRLDAPARQHAVPGDLRPARRTRARFAPVFGVVSDRRRVRESRRRVDAVRPIAADHRLQRRGVGNPGRLSRAVSARAPGLVLPLGLYLQFIRVPAALLIGMWVLLQLLFTWAGPGFGTVVWWAHLAGFGFGILFAVISRGAVERRLRQRSY